MQDSIDKTKLECSELSDQVTKMKESSISIKQQVIDL